MLGSWHRLSRNRALRRFGSEILHKDVGQMAYIRSQIGELPCARAARQAELATTLWIVHAADNRGCKSIGIARSNRQTIHFIADQFRNSVHPGGNAWNTERHSLHENHRDAFRKARQDKGVGLFVDFPQLSLIQESRKLYRVSQS